MRIPLALRRYLGIAALLLPSTAGHAQSAPEFYKGRTLSIIVGYGPGGGYDTYGRVLARHLGKHIPGNPTVVPKNMPGAGSLKAANHIFNSAPRDGTEIGLVAASTLLEPLLGNVQAQFVAPKFSWLGSMSQDVSFCAIRGTAGVSNFDEWLRSKKELIFGSAGPAATSHQHPLILKNVFGVNARIVAGYDGTRDAILAIQRQEMDGICGLQVSAIKAQFQDLLDRGQLKLIIQMGPEKLNVFGDVPSVFDHVKSDFERKVMELHFGQLKLARPFMAPPGIPADREKLLQDAFEAAMKDPELLEDAKKAGIDIEPVSGPDAQKLLAYFSKFPKPVIEKAKENIGR